MEISYREIKEDKKEKEYLKCIMKICLNFAKMEVRYY